LQLKKFELEFAVDPLFKKASADFDEGGAKGLLLNHLSIDDTGRIVFDSSDDMVDGVAKEESEEIIDADEEGDKTITEERPEADVKVEDPEDIYIDVAALGAKFFPDLSMLDGQDICPSLKHFTIGDPTNTLDIPFLKALNEKEEEAQEQAAMNGLDDDDDFGGAFEGGPGVGENTEIFGGGGEAWANETMPDAARMLMTPMKGSRPEMDDEINIDGEFDPSGNDYVVRLGHREPEADDILAYFDEALKKNWAGPEHWRIRRIKGEYIVTIHNALDMKTNRNRWCYNSRTYKTAKGEDAVYNRFYVARSFYRRPKSIICHI